MGTYSNITIENDQFYSLEKHFEIACNRHPHLKLLESQWRFDQELVSKALQNISTIFPHYSRHDASHSKQIIVNIERMLGDKIKYLSATDTWLILEAAYHHDIGMVITQKQIEDMNSEEFRNFVTEISRNKENELCEFAENWLNEKAVLPQNAEAHSFFHKYTQLLAEWYRRKHPYNSSRIVRDPFEEIGLNSPRNELLPKRLFQVLGNICKAHGEDFENVKKLPKAEAGMASEDCHPLYIACLIRMGDLLDVDDNRFCPVMMKMCGSNLPHSSLSHYHKHQSITHFRLDSEQIEIICECPTPESYESAFDWFSWLSKEHNNQTQYWNNIVPCKNLGRLPTLIDPLVKIEQPYEILEIGRKPEFKIDQKALLELVTGANLYKSKLDSLREILQNSVDATILKIWIDNKDKIDFKKENPLSQEFLKLLNGYNIDISFSEVDYNKEEVEISIHDKGVGMDLDGLKFIFEVGASHKNKFKNKLISDIPEWFKPSGAFGLGFQSIFLITDEVVIKTKGLYVNYGLEVEIKRTSNKNIIVIKRCGDDFIGTKITFKMKLDESFNIRGDYYDEEIDRRDNDPVLNFENKLDVRLRNIKRYCNKFLLNSIFKNEYNCYNFLPNNIVLKSISFDRHWSDNPFNSICVSFRGQLVEDHNSSRVLGNRFVALDIDLYSYDAKKILNFSRNAFTYDFSNELSELIIKIIKDNILENWNSFGNNEKINAAGFMLYHTDWKEPIFKEYVDIFIEQEVEYLNVKKKLSDIICDIEEYNYILSYEWGSFGRKVKNIYEDINYENKYEVGFLDFADISIFNIILNYRGFYPQLINASEDFFSKIFCSYSSERKIPLSKEIFYYLVNNVESKKSRLMTEGFGLFDELLVSKRIENCIGIYNQRYLNKYIMYPIKIINNRIVYDESDDLINWIYENRVDKSINRDLIELKIKEFIEVLKIHLS